ncbi:Retrovirus-related Pol polyprotein from transposon TNT 1-94 [Trichinella pseudospiralis]|uniref:Retrovirus-related Pol polyprotein from transposon TNT 1-94 n=1 Tax=Trichinella pseudospiralis TaxID=6337 RepID=A0A0V1F5N7_TRIPS|nr:Retrovirus-related Pol polyprotein from transposon TNT 1-94 [Trichinella pseudospiralis]
MASLKGKEQWKFAGKPDGWVYGVIGGACNCPNLWEDYDETFTSVVRYETIHILFNVAAVKSLNVPHFDIKCAYLNAEYQEKLYMEHPHCFEDSSNKNIIWAKFSMSLVESHSRWKYWNKVSTGPDCQKLKTLKLTGTRLASIFSGIVPHPLEPFQTAAAARTPCDRTPSLQRALPRCHQHATLLRIVTLSLHGEYFRPRKGTQYRSEREPPPQEDQMTNREKECCCNGLFPFVRNYFTEWVKAIKVQRRNLQLIRKRLANHQNETKLVENGAEQKGSRTSVELGKMHGNSCQIQCAFNQVRLYHHNKFVKNSVLLLDNGSVVAASLQDVILLHTEIHAYVQLNHLARQRLKVSSEVVDHAVSATALSDM